MSLRLTGRAAIPGKAEGKAIVSNQPISFWGGVNSKTGEVIDRRHDCSGKILTGSIFVFPTGRGSSTGSAVLMECVRNQVNPAAIINSKVDPILALGAVIVELLYQKTLPMIILSEEDLAKIHDDDDISIGADGTVIIN